VSRSLRRGALAATAVVFSIASLAACGAGNDAQTLEIKPDNAAVTKGDIKVQNALVITQGEKGKKGPASVSATLFNAGDTPQTLDGITLPGAKSKVALKGAEGSGKVVVPAGGSVVLGGKGNASAVVEGGSAAVEAGNAQEVVFQLSAAGDVPIAAFVVPATGMYAGFGPTEAPAAAGATPSGSPSGTPSGSPSGSPSGAAGATPSGSPSGTPSGSPSHGAGH
jgi:copper(I)-binding protein